MANFASPVSTYSDTTPQKRVITDVMSLIDPSDAPAVEALGGLDGAASKFRFLNTPGTVCEWLQDTLSPLAGAMAAISLTGTSTTISVADVNMFQAGHILLVESEQMWVSATTVATSLLTVTRGFNSSSTATHTSSTVITIIGMARLEGAASTGIGYTDRTTGSNASQIFHKELKVTGTQQIIQQYGISDEMAYQGDKAIPEQMRLIERQLQYGIAAAGSASTPRTFGGYGNFITTNLVDGSSLTQAKFETAVLSCYNNGGGPEFLAFMNPLSMQKVKNFYDSSNFLRVDTGETTVGMVIDGVRTPYGNVHFVMDRWQLSTTIPIIDAQHAGMLTIRPFQQEPLSKTGDAELAELVGEFTFCLRQEKAHAILTAVS